MHFYSQTFIKPPPLELLTLSESHTDDSVAEAFKRIAGLENLVISVKFASMLWQNKYFIINYVATMFYNSIRLN